MPTMMQLEDEKLFNVILRINSKMFGLILGLLTGSVIFIATNWLILKGDIPKKPVITSSGRICSCSVSFLSAIPSPLLAVSSDSPMGLPAGPWLGP